MVSESNLLRYNPISRSTNVVLGGGFSPTKEIRESISSIVAAIVSIVSRPFIYIAKLFYYENAAKSLARNYLKIAEDSIEDQKKNGDLKYRINLTESTVIKQLQQMAKLCAEYPSIAEAYKGEITSIIYTNNSKTGQNYTGDLTSKELENLGLTI